MKKHLIMASFALASMSLSITSLAASRLAASASGQPLYVITLGQKGLVDYAGDIDGLPAPSSIGALHSARELVQSGPAQSYISYLENEQNKMVVQIEQTLGHSFTANYRYKATMSGFLAPLTKDEVQKLRNMPGIKSVEAEPVYQLQTDSGPNWIGAPGIWNGSGIPANGFANKGEGMVVGVIDTGINTGHPSFAATGGDGYTVINPLGSGHFLGDCIGGTSGNDVVTCNDKLIGAWDLTADGTPEDSNGHGSHTSSISAGNVLNGPFPNVPFTSISGVAPHANIIMYKVCGSSGCTSTSAGIDRAILDGVDAINYSIGPTAGGRNISPWTSSDDSRFLQAVTAGIFVAASAGNTGTSNTNPEADVSHKGPWIATVANSSHDRINKNAVSITGPGMVPANVNDLYGLLGTGPAMSGDETGSVKWAGDIDAGNFEGCNAWTGTPFANSVALISRGACTFADKVNFAEAAGATFVIVFNNAANLPIVMGGLDATTTSSVMVGLTDGENLRDFIMANPTATILVSGTTTADHVASAGNILNPSSLNGPNLDFDLTKPSLTAPGTNIFAAYQDDGNPGADFAFLSGTSMSGPHVAGSGALLLKARPDFSVMEAKSAMMLTADANGARGDGTMTNPDDTGNGTVNLNLAAKTTLVMDASPQSMLDANPAAGGDPKTVNVPSMRSTSCDTTCSWTRTVRNALDRDGQWNVVADGDWENDGSEFSVNVTPSSFSLLPGDTIYRDDNETDSSLHSSMQTIQVDVSGVSSGNTMVFGKLVISENDNSLPTATMSISVSQTLPDTPPVR